MTASRSKNPYIVDNSISGWTTLEYLQRWTDFSGQMDIATGYFEIGALLSLDGHWQKVGKIRILMGSEVTLRTRQALLTALKEKINTEIDHSLESIKDTRPLLSGVDAIVDAMQQGQIEVRVFDDGKFHAKCYITYERTGFFGPQALVGSSNFTHPGLTDNVELNIHVQTGNDVEDLQTWFELHWKKGKDVSPEIITLIEKHVKLYKPFDVYAKALHEYFRGNDMTSNEWEESKSLMFSKLDRYQKEAYWSLIKIAQQHNGAFLCDGVGLGKTFVGLMLIERLILHENKRVVLFAPKAAREGVWDAHLVKYLKHVGLDGVFSNLQVFNHTDLTRESMASIFARVADFADVVIIDEAHHFRNTGQQPNPELGVKPNRYYQMLQLIVSSRMAKQVFLLTATPINNGLSDFRHLVELFTQRNDSYFGRTLGINSVKNTFNLLEQELRKRLDLKDTDVLTDRGEEASDFINSNAIFRSLVVQRSRAYARESQRRENKNTLTFPTRQPPVVVKYSLRASYGALFDLFDDAFKRDDPLFTLAMYNPTSYLKNENDMDTFEKNRLIAVVGLIRTNFLKRFESSIVAFEMSSIRLFKKLMAFVRKHATTDAEQNEMARWERKNAADIAIIQKRFATLNDLADSDLDEDFIDEELLDAVTSYDKKAYHVERMVKDTYFDMDVLVGFLRETSHYNNSHDDKVIQLKKLLKSPEIANQKVLIFTEFADTAQYLAKELIADNFDGVEQIDSSSSSNRADVITRFAPYYNNLSATELRAKSIKPIRILISTDVLSEGLNLQDATFMINYDIHWNPVRLMQRIGRVDRRLNPEIERDMLFDEPELQEFRGKVRYWNFLPPTDLNQLLSLYKRVTNKTLVISEVFGIEGGKLLTPEDNLRALVEFNAKYEGQKTKAEELRLEYQKLLTDYPHLEGSLRTLPLIHSGKQNPEAVRGIFFCYALPAYDTDTKQYTYDAGTVRWYLYDVDKKTIISEATDISDHIRSLPDTPRVMTVSESEFLDVRKKIESEIKNKYLRKIDAPVGVRAQLRCWMELQ